MFLKRISAMFLMAVLATAAHAAGDAGKAKKPAKAAPSSEDLICTYEQPVGTHIRRRTCVTRGERDERARRDQDAMQRMRGPGAPAGAGASGN